jgi:hypothetical protein
MIEAGFSAENIAEVVDMGMIMADTVVASAVAAMVVEGGFLWIIMAKVMEVAYRIMVEILEHLRRKIKV